MERAANAPQAGWTQTRVAKRLGIDYPIVQGPFGGFATQRLTAEVSNFGALGSLGVFHLSPSGIKDAIAELRSLTSKPFAMNLWVSTHDVGALTSCADAFEKSLAVLSGRLKELGQPLPEFTPFTPARFEEQVRVLLDEKVPAFSFIFGIPPREILDECRAKGVVTIGTATTRDEAVALEQAGVDVVGASGFEAAGHRGSFLQPSEESLTGTISLVPQIVDAVKLPVIAAGGIADARGVVAALALGAEAVQIGTPFLTCDGSGASRLHRETLLTERARRTGLTKGFTGRLARGIQNELMAELNRPDAAILPYPLQRALVKNLTVPAEAAGRVELLSLWAGQSTGLSQPTSATAYLEELVAGVSEVGDIICNWSAAKRI